MVSWVLRRRSFCPSLKLSTFSGSTASSSRWPLTIVHSLRKKRCAPDTPSSLHSSVCSGGAANIVNRRTVSAPCLSMAVCGSTPLFFDFDILVTPPLRTSSPVAVSVALIVRPFSSLSTVTSSGDNHSLRPPLSL